MDGDSDLKDAIEMMGWGDFEIHPASTVMVGSDDGLVECEQPTFIQIKTGFRDRHLAKLKGAKLSVFLCIALHMDGNKVAFPSQATIAKETGYSRVEVSRCVSELEALNMLKVQRDAKQVNVYKVLQMARFGRPRNEKLHAPMRQKLHGTAAKVTCPPDKSYTEEEPIKKNQEEVRAMSPEDHARLLEVFAPYWEEKEIEDRIAECLAYPFARTKGRNWYLTTRQWLRTETEKQRSRNGQYPNNPSSAVTKRSRAGTLEQWREWEQRQKKGIHASDVPL